LKQSQKGKKMNIKYAGLAALAGSMLLCLGLPAFGQDVSVQFTGGYTTTWGNNSGDFGAGIYSANINGQSSPGIICDDFNDEITSGETWNATPIQVSTLASGALGNTLFGNNPNVGLNGYAEMAELASMMFSGGSAFGSITGITQAELSSAIWDIGLGGGLQGLDSKAASLVTALQTYFNVNSAATYLDSLTNLWILTPDPKNVQGEPQEMWTENLSVPEGGAAFLYLLLAGITCFGAMFLNARKQAVKRVTA
jgi:hypothetical protein